MKSSAVFAASPIFLRSWDRAWSGLIARKENPAGVAPAPDGPASDSSASNSAVGGGEKLRDRLLLSYQETHRHYHTLQHLAECLGHFERSRDLATHPAEVEIALWLHDAVYHPKRSDNEERSAEQAKEMLPLSACPATIERVRSLILATKHTRMPQGSDEKLLVDIDLAILGAEKERFVEYEAQIRDEYSFVPRWIFRKKRSAILQEFLRRPSIYATDFFREELEGRARENLKQVTR